MNETRTGDDMTSLIWVCHGALGFRSGRKKALVGWGREEERWQDWGGEGHSLRFRGRERPVREIRTGERPVLVSAMARVQHGRSRPVTPAIVCVCLRVAERRLDIST